MFSLQASSRLPLNQDLPLTQVLFKKHSILGPHIQWLKKKGTLLEKIFKTFLASLEIAFLSLTIVGIGIVKKGFRISQKLDGYLSFEKPPNAVPSFDRTPVLFKNKQQAFSHCHEFTILEGHIWYRPIEYSPTRFYHPLKQDSQWQRLYFDGHEENCQAEEISADGANLIVKCNRGDIHYKKTVQEFRLGKSYAFLDKCQKDNWKPIWFALPVVSALWNLFAKPRIRLPKDCIAWDISHRGQYNYYYTDAKGNDHIDLVGITTLYALTKNSEIFYADAWLPGGFAYRIPPIPFEHAPLINLSASASTLFTIDANYRLYTAELDFDILGKDPLFSYYQDPSKNLPRKIFLPPRGWMKQPLPVLQGQARITSEITILQTADLGNQARVLRIRGLNHCGEAGYYVKKIEDPDWSFIETQLAP